MYTLTYNWYGDQRYCTFSTLRDTLDYVQKCVPFDAKQIFVEPPYGCRYYKVIGSTISIVELRKKGGF